MPPAMRALTLSLDIAGLVACLPPSIIFLETATAQTNPARKAEADSLLRNSNVRRGTENLSLHWRSPT